MKKPEKPKGYYMGQISDQMEKEAALIRERTKDIRREDLAKPEPEPK